MIDFLYSIDVAIFFFINHTLANPFLDWLMPFLTDLNKQKLVVAGVIVLVGWIFWKGGPSGRVAVGVLIVTIIISDQLNSSILKELFHRIRPCRALEGVRLLVDCAPCFSAPGDILMGFFFHSKFRISLRAKTLSVSM